MGFLSSCPTRWPVRWNWPPISARVWPASSMDSMTASRSASPSMVRCTAARRAAVRCRSITWSAMSGAVSVIPAWQLGVRCALGAASGRDSGLVTAPAGGGTHLVKRGVADGLDDVRVWVVYRMTAAKACRDLDHGRRNSVFGIVMVMQDGIRCAQHDFAIAQVQRGERDWLVIAGQVHGLLSISSRLGPGNGSTYSDASESCRESHPGRVARGALTAVSHRRGDGIVR